MSVVETTTRKSGWARRWSRSRETRWGVGLTSIWLVGFLVFAAVPLAMSVYISFTNWEPISGPFWNAHTIGLHNYHTFLTDHVYWHSVANTIYYAVGSVGVVNLVALPMAMLLNRFDISSVDTPDGRPPSERMSFTMAPEGLRMQLSERVAA